MQYSFVTQLNDALRGGHLDLAVFHFAEEEPM